MCITTLVKTGLIIYVDNRLTSLLGPSAKSWLGKRPIDYLYHQDANLLLTKLCDLTKKFVRLKTNSLNSIKKNYLCNFVFFLLEFNFTKDSGMS